MKIAFAPDARRPCGKCLACADACRLGLDPMQEGLYPQCHNCGACVEACRAMKADKKPLAFKF
jgi:Fe-S-cluster-containing dehydrogenase component